MMRSRRIDEQFNRFSIGQAIFLVVNYFVGMHTLYPLLGAALTRFIYGYDGINVVVMSGIYIVVFVTSVFVVRKPLKSSWQHFTRSKKAFLTNIKEIFKSWGFLMLFTIGTNLLVTLLLGQGAQAGNQTAVVDQFKNFPVFTGLITLVFAPVVEELVFRGALYQQFRSPKMYWGAIIISSLIFGGIHVFPQFAQSHNLSELLYLIPYGGMSVFMIRAFEKTDSIYGAMGVHLINNTLALIQIIMTL